MVKNDAKKKKKTMHGLNRKISKYQCSALKAPGYCFALREAGYCRDQENEDYLCSFVTDSAAGSDKHSFIARLDNNGNKTSIFYQIQYLPSLVREHDAIKLPILPSHSQLFQTKR